VIGFTGSLNVNGDWNSFLVNGKFWKAIAATVGDDIEIVSDTCAGEHGFGGEFTGVAFLEAIFVLLAGVIIRVPKFSEDLGLQVLSPLLLLF
jgi:hypothetical protein